MAKHKFEYLWLDGYKPEPNLRSKTKVMDLEDYKGDMNVLPIWAFDGSSTMQADGHSSDLLLQPCAIYPDPERNNGWLVMCEVLNPDETPHASNTRATYSDDKDFWFGFEQEYVLINTDNNLRFGFPAPGFHEPLGKYFFAFGTGIVTCRVLVENHLHVCFEAVMVFTVFIVVVFLGTW
jgi:glutamine synthetase